MLIVSSFNSMLSDTSYKLPNRVVYNETMKKSFLSDLADERIPLNSPKFAKSVPHGMKGADLLEMLWTKRIKVERAVWLIQVIGAHDVVSSLPGQANIPLTRPCLPYSKTCEKATILLRILFRRPSNTRCHLPKRLLHI